MFFIRKDFLPKMISEPSPTSDEKLAQLVQAGDQQALERLVERYANRFYRTAYGFLKNKDDSEDMVQTAFLKFWQQPQKWDPSKNAKFTTWFYRVVVNLCLDHLKKKKPAALPENHQAVDPKSFSEENLDKARQAQLLEQHIKALPDRQRTALNLCFFEGLSNQEAADIMGIKLKALQSLLMRAKGNLKGKLS